MLPATFDVICQTEKTQSQDKRACLCMLSSHFLASKLCPLPLHECCCSLEAGFHVFAMKMLIFHSQCPVRADCALHSSRKVYVYKLFLNCIGELTHQYCHLCNGGRCSYTLTSCCGLFVYFCLGRLRTAMPSCVCVLGSLGR